VDIQDVQEPGTRITRVGVYDQSATRRGGRRGGEAGLRSVRLGMCCGGLEKVRRSVGVLDGTRAGGVGGGGGTHG
jgi:hypothetical protein